MELALELKALADRAREGRATVEELQGSTMTITNVGAIGGTGFTPDHQLSRGRDPWVGSGEGPA